jgi:ubiquinone/menaquinone biosynthesis C-methylase UbiE
MEKFYNIEEQKLWNDVNMWSEGGHEWSGPFGTTEKLWNEHIFETVKPFRGKRILEIAPGFGRITQFLSILAGELVVVDLNPNCIEATRAKLGNHISGYFVNDGKSLSDIKDNSQDLVFSYDSFVHMHANVVEEYIKEFGRVLVSGGGGFIHHSWFSGGQDKSFNNIAGRANMTPELFKQLIELNGMEIVSQKPIQFFETTDIISFFRKL